MNQSDNLEIRVECYAGYRGEQTPKRFYIRERCIEIEDELDRWIDPDHRYFKVRGKDGGIYILRHDVKADCWEMTMYYSGHNTDSPLSST
jgi:hypothetical protein